MDGITRHVVEHGFTEKVRELRTEFFSKDDFAIQTQTFAKVKDLDAA